MLTRREFIDRSLKGSSLFAVGATVPMFVAKAAGAARPGKDSVLVVVELTGGNDGLNTVVPCGDDEYYKARPTLAVKKENVIRVGDGIGLNDAMRGLSDLHEDGSLAIVQGVGYPNPNRSHFESMDIWHTADPDRKRSDGWLGRGLSLLKPKPGGIPAFHIGSGELPLAMKGGRAAAPTLNPDKSFGLDLGGGFVGRKLSSDDPASDLAREATAPQGTAARKELIYDAAKLSAGGDGGLLDFARRTTLETYTSIERLQELMKQDFRLPDAEYGFRGGRYREVREGLVYELNLVARMIQAGFGTRIFYVALGGFDTHSDQRKDHNELLGTLGDAVGQFFSQLKSSGDDGRTLLMTFSEFGRRVAENGSRGTDHGAASCLFVAGAACRGGLHGDHPSLRPDELGRGDLKFHTDFRSVYATLLEEWLKCDSRRVLGGEFSRLPLLKRSRAGESES